MTQRTLALPKTGDTAEVLFQKTLNKRAFLEGRGIKVVSIWEHEYDANPPQSVGPVPQRLDPRDSFFGGRTNATRLHYKAGPGQTIEYADFTSLYPSVNKQCRYPVGHPQIIVRDFGPLESYFGIAKVNKL